MRTTIFISHANPEDNDFAIWLCSRLSALGYEVWIDKNGLLGGEKFWEEIDQTIRYSAIKFVLIYSRNICYKDQVGKLKDGIYKEFSLAESIGRQERLKDFIQLLNIDGSARNLFIGADRLNQIAFSDNWAEGLEQLNEKLKKDDVPRSSAAFDTEFANWYENKYILRNGIIPKNEIYYTSYWPITALPSKFYLFHFESVKQASALYLSKELKYPLSKIANALASFSGDLPLRPTNSELEPPIKPKSSFEVNTNDVLQGFESSAFPTHRDASNHLKALLARTFHLLMKQRGLFWCGMSNKRQTYYFTAAGLRNGKIKFSYPISGKQKTKTLVGKHLSLGKWHYAISALPILQPIQGYSLKSHIVFTTNGFKPWDNKDKMHSHRRAKGRLMFNGEWRDLFLGFLSGLKNTDGSIDIQLTDTFTLTMASSPLILESEFGYIEPVSKRRFDVLEQEITVVASDANTEADD
ncbi:MAG TPA: toll/interleukin-1 receptor domain-containing protein [Candidatus Hodarchaeales archaeon]|nr:toll/interleukin-1 receptor domain-containing protein [Candidatus Hodarchaeales archaeon]